MLALPQHYKVEHVVLSLVLSSRQPPLSNFPGFLLFSLLDIIHMYPKITFVLNIFWYLATLKIRLWNREIAQSLG